MFRYMPDSPSGGVPAFVPAWLSELRADQFSDEVGDRSLMESGEFRDFNPGDLPRIADNPEYSYLVWFAYERSALMDDIPQGDNPGRM